MLIAICVRRLTGTSLCRSLEFFIYTLTREHVQVLNPITQLTGIIQHPVIEFHFQVDTGTSGTKAGLADFATEADIELH